MKHIFYFLGILCLIIEFNWILDPSSRAEKALRVKRLSKQHKGMSYDEFSGEYKEALKGMIGEFLIMFGFLFGGLFTFQWPLFLIALLFNIIIIAPLSKISQNSKPAYISLHWVNSIIGAAIFCFAIINSYHLKIDIYEYLKTIF